MFVATSAFAFASCDKIDLFNGAKGEKGDKGATGLAGKDGADGLTITGVEYNAAGELVFTFSDGTTSTVADPNAHTHTYGEWTKLMGETCEDGMFARACTCGYVEWKKGIDHAWGLPTVVEATCTKRGTSTKVCTRCEETEVEYLLMDHTFTEEDTAKEVCTTCNYTVKGTTGLGFEQKADGTYKVTAYVGNTTTVVIPGVYNNELVTEIATNVFIGTSATELSIVKKVTIPTTVTKIGQAAFAYTSLTAIDIPDSVTELGKNAFKGCPNMKKATIGSGITSMNPEVHQTIFNGCTALETVTYNSPVIGYRMFYNCSALKTVKLGAEMTEIQQEAFRGCAALTEEGIDFSKINFFSVKGVFQGTAVKNVTLPATCTAIPNATFATSKIESIVMGNVTTVGKQAFTGCTEFKAVYYTCAQSAYVAPTVGASNEPFDAATKYFYSETEPTTEGNFWHYVEGVATPWETASTEPSEPTEPTEPTMTFTFELNADQTGYIVKKYTGNVKEVVIPATYEGKPVVEIYSAGKGGEAAFQGNTDITSVTIPGSIKTFGAYAFTSCTALKTVTIQEGVTDLNGIYGFSGCSALETVNLPSTLKSIYRNMFASCAALKTLVIPEGVKTIGYRAFWGCAFDSLSLPSTLTGIGKQLFTDGREDLPSSGATAISYNGTQAQWDALILNEVTGNADATAAVPESSNKSVFDKATFTFAS